MLTSCSSDFNHLHQPRNARDEPPERQSVRTGSLVAQPIAAKNVSTNEDGGPSTLADRKSLKKTVIQFLDLEAEAIEDEEVEMDGDMDEDFGVYPSTLLWPMLTSVPSQIFCRRRCSRSEFISLPAPSSFGQCYLRR